MIDPQLVRTIRTKPMSCGALGHWSQEYVLEHFSARVTRSVERREGGWTREVYKVLVRDLDCSDAYLTWNEEFENEEDARLYARAELLVRVMSDRVRQEG